MNELQVWARKTPAWTWFSIFPVFGGLAIVYAGYKVNHNKWMYLGGSFVILAFLFSAVDFLVTLVWIAQITTAFSLRGQFLRLQGNNTHSLERDASAISRDVFHQIDINDCSKDDLVRGLGIPIVYANDIELAKTEGYIFTHLEELTDIAGLPTNYVNKLSSLVVFRYDIKKEGHISWRRLNTFTELQLINCGLSNKEARLIVETREKSGNFSSVVDMVKKTGIPLSSCQKIL